MSMIEQESEEVPPRLLRVFAIAIGVAIVLSILVTLVIGRGSLGEVMREVSSPPANIETRVFPLETDQERSQRETAERLRSYGWVDRDRGLVHVPLDVAIELYLKEATR